MKTPAELFSLAGRVALVTGSTRGLGWAMAQALAAAGATVAVNARDAALAKARAEAIGGHAYPGDVADEAQCVALVDAIVARHGRLDILVNNAGAIQRGPIAEHSKADWDRVLGVNVDAAFMLARQAVPVMKAQRHGRIVNVGSVVATIARAGGVSYVTSKHALAGLTRAIAVECATQGITCNLIAPGFFATDLNAEARKNPVFVEPVIRRTPARRWGEPDDLATTVLFLASDASGYVNGQVVHVDGGMVAAF